MVGGRVVGGTLHWGAANDNLFWTGNDGGMAQKYKLKWNMGGRGFDGREPIPSTQKCQI